MIVLLSCTGAKFRNPENGFRHGFAVHPGSTKLRNTYYLLVPLLHCADLVSFGECTMAPCKYTMKMLGSASKLPLSLFKSHGTWMFFLVFGYLSKLAAAPEETVGGGSGATVGRFGSTVAQAVGKPRVCQQFRPYHCLSQRQLMVKAGFVMHHLVSVCARCWSGIPFSMCI